MTPDEKLAAILAAVQTDPGNRGLGRDPEDNLFSATKGDFRRSCRRIATPFLPQTAILSGFYIPGAVTPAFETDGPLGACFLKYALSILNISCGPIGEDRICRSVYSGLSMRSGFREIPITRQGLDCLICIECSGPAADGRNYSMRGRDLTDYHSESNWAFQQCKEMNAETIGIGDGGNEIGMGKIPHETIVKNIPNGDLIHCRVPTDHLIVAGVSNWGAYALAAGIFVLKGITPPDDLFDPDREREILEVMVKAGPLVDGVTGKQEATVDGLTWEEYVKPLVRIREILNS